MTPLEEYEAALKESLASLEARGLLRSLRPSQGVDLVSNDYLGLAGHPLIRERVEEAASRYGVGAGAARLLTRHHEVFARLEERLASFSGVESALLFGSGYLANLGLLGSVLTKEDLVLSDEQNHASLIDGIRLSGAHRVVYPHLNLEAVESALTHNRGRAFIVTESVFSMDGDRAPLSELAAVAETRGALLIVDEAHATGLYGGRGSGLVEELGLRSSVLATVHTGGKALGCGGAWVAGSARLKDHLVNRARTFVFTTAPLLVLPPALEAALDLLENEPERRVEVHRKAALLRRALQDGGVRVPGNSQILPVVVGSPEAALDLEEGLRRAGFDARAIRPPTVPAGTSRIRVTVRFPVSDQDLLRFADVLCRIRRAQAA